jgi:3-isopropylmalate dehydrogenase
VADHFRVAVIGGDGIGAEVVEAALPVIETAGAAHDITFTWDRLPYGADHYLATGETLPSGTLDRLRDEFDAILLGALGDPRIPENEHARDILLGMRVGLDLYVNFRPCRLLHPQLCPLKPPSQRPGCADPDAEPHIDFVIFRENTEGIYLARGSASNVGSPAEVQIAEEINTAPRVSRIVRAAFEWARAHGRHRVTLCDKANAVPAHRLWQRLFAEIGEEYAEIEREHRYVDALAMELVRAPERFQVIVTNNLFGDILSDLGAELVGGLGLAASANLHPGQTGLFEPVHGSAPPMAGKGIANPMAAILTGGLMLEQLGCPAAADRLVNAVESAIAVRRTTPDLGGTASTVEVSAWIADCIARS